MDSGVFENVVLCIEDEILYIGWVVVFNGFCDNFVVVKFFIVVGGSLVFC